MLNNNILRWARKRKLLDRNPPMYCSCSNCERDTKTINMKRVMIGIITISILLFLGISAFAEAIDIPKIAMIESSNNPNAYNRISGAIGLTQILPAALKDYNRDHRTHHDTRELFVKQFNLLVADYYINHKIVKYLNYFGIKDTVVSRLACYNWGIGNVVKWQKKGGKYNELPKETREYYRKYCDLLHL